jgi:phytoene dehydrogenase-like protein
MPMSEPADDFDALVVGAGHNGLVASFYLARAGLRVMVAERRHLVGGACVTEELMPGYQFSTCSFVAWLLQPRVIADMDLTRHGFRHVLLDPWRTSIYADGTCLRYWDDPADTRREMAGLSPRDADAYPAYQDFWRRATEIIYPFFLTDPPDEAALRRRAREIGEEATLDRLMGSSIADISCGFFEDPRIQAAVVKVGEVGDPWLPGSALTESYFHFTTPLHQAIPVGGMGAITQAMARSAAAAGVTIRTDAAVERVLVDGDMRARGVRLADGQEIRAGLVISNADPKRTYLGLLEKGVLTTEFEQRVRGLSTATSYLKMHCVLSRLPDLSAHLGPAARPRDAGYLHIAPSLEYFRDAHRAALSGDVAERPVVHIQVPTVYDVAMSSNGDHLASVWVMYAPPALRQGRWEEARQATGEALLAYIDRFLPGFGASVRDWMLLTPQDMADRVGLTGGNIRHLDMVPGQFLAKRPLDGAGYRTPVEGLYLCGAGTHPGGEVTGAPGHNAAHAILRELAGAGAPGR